MPARLAARRHASRIASAVSAAAATPTISGSTACGARRREREDHVAVDRRVDGVDRARHAGVRHLRDDPAADLRELRVGHRRRRASCSRAAHRAGSSAARSACSRSTSRRADERRRPRRGCRRAPIRPPRSRRRTRSRPRAPPCRGPCGRSCAARPTPLLTADGAAEQLARPRRRCPRRRCRARAPRAAASQAA